MKLTFTGTTAVDVTTNGDVVNAMLCQITRELMVVEERVTDSLGGICGAPSSLTTAAAPASDDGAGAETTPVEEETDTEGTSNEGSSEERLLEEEGDGTDTSGDGTDTSEEDTEPVNTDIDSVIEMVVLPDAYAAVYTVEDVITQATSPEMFDALSAVEGVAELGEMGEIVAEVIVETEVELVGDVDVTATTDNVSMVGTTTAAGYVLCWMEKNG